MKRWIWGLVTLLAMFVLVNTASAQGFGGYGHGGYDCDYGFGRYGGYGGIGGYGSGVGLYSAGYRGLNIGYGGLNFSYGYQPRFHDTSHLHYHPGSFQRHGHHFHYVPGHYEVHRTGHWHR